VNKTEEARIIDLLQAYNQRYVHLPFVLDDYAKREFRFDDYHVPDIVHSKDYRGYKVTATALASRLLFGHRAYHILVCGSEGF
jgi:hypothetical protein